MNRRGFLALIGFCGIVHAVERKPDMSLWNNYDTFWVKKDQVAKYHFVIDGVSKFLTLRWTLFVNDGLVMLYNYEKWNYQNILYRNYQLEGFRLNLKNRAENAFDLPYVLIVFADFDEKKKEAQLEIFIKDEKRTILVERLTPKDE